MIREVDHIFIIILMLTSIILVMNPTNAIVSKDSKLEINNFDNSLSASHKTSDNELYIDGNSELEQLRLDYGLSGNGTVDFPIIINQDDIGIIYNEIYIFSTNLFIIITNFNLVGYSGHGISLNGLSNVIITNNTLNSTDSPSLTMGIFSYNSKNIIIENNEIYLYSFYVGIQIRQSTNLLIQDNEIEIISEGSSSIAINIDRATNLTITDNIISSKNSNFSEGIRSSGGINIEISNNILEGGYKGLSIGSENSSVYGNIFANNYWLGILLLGLSRGSIIENNDFIGKNEYGCTVVYDIGFNNLFSKNYWHHWEKQDNNEDGIADQPYKIDGDADNADNQPLMEPNNRASFYYIIPEEERTDYIPIVIHLIALAGLSISVLFNIILRGKLKQKNNINEFIEDEHGNKITERLDEETINLKE